MIDRIARYVRGGRDETFDALAGDAFRYQCKRCEPLRRLAADAAIADSTEIDWWQVPMVPTLAYRTLSLGVAPAVEEFHSSGTAGDRTSVHRHPFPDLYRTVIDETFAAGALGDLRHPPILSLVPDRSLAPHSSLAFMIDHAVRGWGAPDSAVAVAAAGLRAPEARGFLAARQRDGRATLIIATSFALLDLLDALDRLGLSFRLPPGSRLFDTGGTKGRRREVSRDLLIERVWARLGIEPDRIVREYGMTELTSHFYAGSRPHDDRDRFITPPWVRVRVLDPLTLEKSPAGERGLLAVFDLANVGTALHLLTEDLATAERGGFRLHGRAEGADLRGCSLLSESMSG